MLLILWGWGVVDWWMRLTDVAPVAAPIGLAAMTNGR